MRKQKNGNARPMSSLERMVEKICNLCGCSSTDELFLRASMVCGRNKLAVKRAVAAYNTFLKDGRLVHWIRRVFHKILEGRLRLPELKPNTA